MSEINVIRGRRVSSQYWLIIGVLALLGALGVWFVGAESCGGFDSFRWVTVPYEPIYGNAKCNAATPQQGISRKLCQNCTEGCEDVQDTDTREMEVNEEDCEDQQGQDRMECD